ncbi:MAG: hypothetical protein IKM39_04730, partial [Clostridia bacterium]|nr:hypothetical protein [Clostridia bacterium]
MTMYNNSYIPPAPELPYGGICAVNPVVATIKGLGRSAMFLWICILQTVVAGLTLLNTILLSAGINLIEGLVDMSGLDVPDEVFEILDVTSASTGLAFVFPALFALGFWLIRAACKSDGSPFVTTGGLTTMKVLITISLVMLYIVAGCIPFMILAFLFLLGSETDLSPYIGEFDEGYIDDFSDFPVYEFESAFSGVFFGAMVIVLAIALVVLVVCIVYYHFLLRGMNTLKENCEGILSDRSFPMFVVVWLYIMAGCSFVTALLSLSLVSV